MINFNYIDRDFDFVSARFLSNNRLSGSLPNLTGMNSLSYL